MVTRGLPDDLQINALLKDKWVNWPQGYHDCVIWYQIQLDNRGVISATRITTRRGRMYSPLSSYGHTTSSTRST